MANHLALITAETTCPAFCLHHDPGVDELCIGPAIVLDFGPADPSNPDVVHNARIITFNERHGGVTLSLVVNGTSNADFTPAKARQIGTALIQAAAYVTEGGA